MRKCSVCGEAIPDNCAVCWKCGANREGMSADPSASGTEAQAAEDSDCLTRFEIAELACKILALWVLAQAALSITPLLLVFPFMLFTQSPDRSIGSTVILGATPLGTLLVGILLWIKSTAIARRMVRDDRTPVIRTDFTKEDLMTIAFAAIGMYAVWASANGLCRTAVQIFYFVREYGVESSSFWQDTAWHAGVLGQLVGLAFGLWLLLGSRGIVRIVQRIRGEGQDADPDTADGSEPQS